MCIDCNWIYLRMCTVIDERPIYFATILYTSGMMSDTLRLLYLRRTRWIGADRLNDRRGGVTDSPLLVGKIGGAPTAIRE